MGFIGKIVSGITSSLGNIAKTALKAVAPKVTDLLPAILHHIALLVSGSLDVGSLPNPPFGTSRRNGREVPKPVDRFLEIA